MILDILLLIVGLALILFGANYLTEGSADIARRFGISELVVGLTIVAFGTSAPELVISVMSAIKGSAGLAVGNVVGSNIFNILAIVGIVSIIRPVKIAGSSMNTDIPLVILSCIALLACGNASLLDPGSQNCVTRVDGILLLLFFLIFLRYTFAIARNGSSGECAESAKKPRALWLSVMMIPGGLAGLIYGGNLFVDSASSLAASMGVSDAVIGLTVVAVGTSLPELATSIVAAVKNRPGLAVGNVIGSCLFNIFLVLGLSATIRPLPMGGIGNLDLLTMTGAAVLFWIFGHIIGDKVITRAEGSVMTLCYIAYTALLILSL